MTDDRERLREAAQNVTDRRTLMADGFWVSQKEMNALDAALSGSSDPLDEMTLAKALPYYRENNVATCVEDARAILANLHAGMCGAISYSGPNSEPLACAYPPNPPAEPMHTHSWAALPTFLSGSSDSEAVGPNSQAEDLLAALAERGIYSRGDLTLALGPDAKWDAAVARVAVRLTEAKPETPT